MFGAVVSLMILSAGRPAAAAVPALMPLPVKVDTTPGSLPIDGSFTASAAGCGDPRLAGAVARLTARLARQTGIPIGFGQTPAARPTLQVTCATPGPPWPALGDDESYQLDVAAGGTR